MTVSDAEVVAHLRRVIPQRHRVPRLFAHVASAVEVVEQHFDEPLAESLDRALRVLHSLRRCCMLQARVHALVVGRMCVSETQLIYSSSRSLIINSLITHTRTFVNDVN